MDFIIDKGVLKQYIPDDPIVQFITDEDGTETEIISRIISVVIPKGVTNIGKKAFFNY